MSVVFYDEKFYKDINLARQRRNISWNKLATRAGLTPSSLINFARNWEDPKRAYAPIKSLALESVVKLMHWLGESDISKYTISEDELEDVRKNRRGDSADA